MRSVWMIAVSVFLLVTAGALGISWVAQAVQARHFVEDAIARINANEKLITYESLETSGFPRYINISLVNPHFSGRVDQLLKKMSADRADSPFGDLPAWQMDAALNGRFTVGVSAFSTHYRISHDGPVSVRENINGTQVAYTIDSSGPHRCELTTAISSGVIGQMWNFAAVKGDGEHPALSLSDLRKFECTMPGSMVSDAVGNEVLLSTGPARFSLGHNPSGSVMELQVSAHFADMELMPAAEAFFRRYQQALTPAPTHASFANHWANAGKANFDMDFSYKGPNNGEAFKQGKIPLEIALNRFAFSNAFGTEEVLFHFNHQLEGEKRTGRFAFKVTLAANKGSQAVFNQNMPGIIAQVYADNKPSIRQSNGLETPNPSYAFIADLQRRYTPEQLYTLLKPAIPDVEALGKMVSSVDIRFSGAPDMTQGEYTLSDLELSATPYGITGVGQAKMLPAQMFPDADATLRCRNCLTMIDDMASYSVRLQQLLQTLSPQEPVAFALTPERAGNIKRFLSELGTPQDDTLSYAIHSSKDGASVNGKGMDAVMGLYMQHIAQPKP